MIGEPVQGVFFDVDIFDLLLFDDMSLIQDLYGVFLESLSISCSQYCAV